MVAFAYVHVHKRIDEETGNKDERYLSAAKSRELASAAAADNV